MARTRRREVIEMARNWNDVKSDPRTGNITDEDRQAAQKLVDTERRTYLAQLRKAHGTTQVELAGQMGVRQATISEIENRDLDHTEVATLRTYVEGLGGQLRVTAQFGDEEHQIA